MMPGTEHPEARIHDAASSSTETLHVQRSPLAKAAAKLLYKRFRIKVLDGRVLVGDFICIDKQGNIILNQTVEQYELNGKTEEKLLGQVLIPAKQRVSCEVEVVAAEKEAIEALLENPI